MEGICRKSFDVMCGDRFVCVLNVTYNPLFSPTDEDLFDYLFKKRPSLRYEKCVAIVENL